MHGVGTFHQELREDVTGAGRKRFRKCDRETIDEDVGHGNGATRKPEVKLGNPLAKRNACVVQKAADSQEE